MFLECRCCDVSKKKWSELMKGSKPISGKWLRGRIRRDLPSLFSELCLDRGVNPYEWQCRATKTHYVYVHSMIEYFIHK